MFVFKIESYNARNRSGHAVRLERCHADLLSGGTLPRASVRIFGFDKEFGKPLRAFG